MLERCRPPCDGRCSHLSIARNDEGLKDFSMFFKVAYDVDRDRRLGTHFAHTGSPPGFRDLAHRQKSEHVSFEKSPLTFSLFFRFVSVGLVK